MEKNIELKKPSPYLLVRHDAEIDQAFKKAVREALLKHKLAGNPVAVSRDGKVAILQPEEIVVNEP
ncbi:MAG: hypothetical protein H0V90_01540 [Blastocatellia bacterium]|nr:hypothetical protein [Blastocatellia bacterium]MDQ3219162.1 hypothetical protein [Acidobacteriota bacterium]